MVQYTFKDIEVFLLDDDLFQWAKSGFADNGFDIESYKLQHPGCEERIELAIAVIRSMKVVEDTESTSQAYKMQSFNRMMNKLHSQDIKSVQPHRTHSYRKVIVYVASIAAFLLLCLGSYYWVSTFKVQEEVELTADMIDSLSRSDQVQVLLDGKQAVGLDKNNAEIRVNENGAVIVDDKLVVASKGEKILMNQVVVPYGKRTKIILPDGSSLWINSGSCISYSSDFATNRRLNVQGEVFLDVKKDEKHPFIVKTTHLEVSVLGTAFNVNDYAKNVETSVVLVRGSVDVKVDNKAKQRLLPNQRLSMASGAVKINEVDVYGYICWKDDIMNFDGQKLTTILNTLSQYYNTKIEIIGSLKDEKCYGSLDLNCTLEEVLESISLTTPLRIVRKGEIIILSPEKIDKESTNL